MCAARWLLALRLAAGAGGQGSQQDATQCALGDKVCSQSRSLDEGVLLQLKSDAQVDRQATNSSNGRDALGCSCAPNSPLNDGGCCSGSINAQGQNCQTMASVTCKNKNCCKDNFHSWCCPYETACIPQSAGSWNPHSCTKPPPKPAAGRVKANWRLLGGGPDSASKKWTYTAGVKLTNTKEYKTGIENAFTASATFGEAGLSFSDTFTASWSQDVTSTVEENQEISCPIECKDGEYIWLYQTVFVDVPRVSSVLPELATVCGQTVCSPYGLWKPPLCPYGYMATDTQCCMDNSWLKNPKDPSAPKLCAERAVGDEVGSSPTRQVRQVR